jgi:hypothetical protein
MVRHCMPAQHFTTETAAFDRVCYAQHLCKHTFNVGMVAPVKHPFLSHNRVSHASHDALFTFDPPAQNEHPFMQPCITGALAKL